MRLSNNSPIAVFIPRIGVLSETFNRRYSHELGEGGCLTLGRSQSVDGWHGPEGKTFVVNVRNTGTPLERLHAKLFPRRVEDGLWSDSRSFSTRVSELLHHHQTSALFSQYLDTGLHLQKVCRQAGVRHIVRGHGYDITQAPHTPWGTKYYGGLHEFDHILVPTPFQADILMGMGVSSEMISSFPCSVDVPPLNQAEKASDGVVRCLAVGRLVTKKAPLVTMKAFFDAASQYEALELTLVGDGPLYEQCLELKRSSKHGHRVHLVGSRSNEEVKRLMAESDIFMQHSIVDPQTGDQEGAPVAILEAMAHALPVLSTKHSGIPFQVKDGETGVLVDEGDEAGMGAALLDLARNEGLRSHLGENGYQRVREEFSWEKEKELIRELCSTS